MTNKPTAEFKREAVRIALTSGLPRKQVAADLGVGHSTLNKWVKAFGDTGTVPQKEPELIKEIERLRRELRIVTDLRRIRKRSGIVSPAKVGNIKKGHSLLRGPKAMRFSFIAGYRGPLPLVRLCQLFDVSPRGLRAWLRKSPSRRQRDDMVLLAHIREQQCLSLGSYGRPRMTAELQELGLPVGERRVGRLMKENGICAVRTRKYKRTTDSDHAFNIAPNLLDQDFSATGPNQKWAGDISYIWTGEGWLYLAVIIDLYSRRVIGWAVSDRMKRDLAIQALQMAINLRQPPPGCLHHTDRGSQYCSHDYQKLLRKHRFEVSMSGKGNCFDNAAVETFFKTLKAELIWRRSWETRRQVELALFEYINGFYNPRRRHSALAGKSPVAFEKKAA